MKHYFNYNFIPLENSLYQLKISKDITKQYLNDIKNELNSFFKDARCSEVILNKNTDKMFFGMCVMPYVSDQNIKDLLINNKKVMINDYSVEIDSKLFELPLNKRELTACLLHEVGHVINDTQSTEAIKDAVNIYIAENDTRIDYEKIYKLSEVFRLALSQSIYKINSMFNREDDEMIADSFVVACGYGQDLSSAYKTILKKTTYLNKNTMNKLVELTWAFNLYNQFGIRRIPAIDSLTYANKVEPSELIKKKIKMALLDLKSNRTNSLLTQESALIDKFRNIIQKSDMRDLRELEEELYEYDVRVKNCDETDVALILVRELNMRISILDDFLLDSKGKPISEKALNLKLQYEYLRKELTKKKLYGDKYYGLFVKTPVIKSRYEV